ncbi:PLD nuclease N-terminal domain-containing protein [Arthrobacter sp. ATA002]|uniref:PLD nuclease N-terminal domain-containing protein n=1 Tax=Arthrobacter sp. ATA002 TaxID=2991715 RepID=UPI0022A6C312|nr:PLD nuclease N-terminal domain-containing protein [Arthrobacter sp. ATA002]WAP50599.1 PLD nuclease N-terminal domain-containing protein [Arthrobacter sp. ATA002]
MLALRAAEGANPVIPAQWEFTVLGIGILALLLFAAAVIGIARSHHLTGFAQAVWVLVVLAFPVIGPLLWFLIGRRANTSSRDAGSNSATGVR